MLRPIQDINLLRALARLSDDPDYVLVCEWLQSEMAELDKKNRTYKEDVPLRQGQGAAMTLQDILEVSASAQETLKRMQSASPTAIRQ